MAVPRETLIVAEQTSRSMRANRSKDTGPEVAFRRALWASGVRGFRKHVRTLPGAPDIVFTKRRIAVFIHGCFWHLCPRCRKDAPLKLNEGYWRSKLEANAQRDLVNNERLQEQGFRVVVIWECDVKKRLADSVQLVVAMLNDENIPVKKA